MGRRPERGITLVEISIVGVLAALVVMGMISFYVSSQSAWMSSSTQAMAQRDGTLLVETVSDSVRLAGQAEVQHDYPLPGYDTLILRDRGGSERCRFGWVQGDSLVHQVSGGVDRGPVGAAPVVRFQLEAQPRYVEIRLVELHAGDGQLVRLSSAAALYNAETAGP